MTKQESIERVQRDGLAIKFITDPSEALCLAAVKENWNAIKFITDPSEAVCFEAIMNNINALKYIKNPSIDVEILGKLMY